MEQELKATVLIEKRVNRAYEFANLSGSWLERSVP